MGNAEEVDYVGDRRHPHGFGKKVPLIKPSASWRTKQALGERICRRANEEKHTPPPDHKPNIISHNLRLYAQGKQKRRGVLVTIHRFPTSSPRRRGSSLRK